MKKIIIAYSLKDFVQKQVSGLARFGNSIFYVGSGREALDIHRKEKADLIIMKPDFPEMACEELCSAIRGDEDLKKVSILMVCSDDLSDIERCQKCGANDYIHSLNPGTFLRKSLLLLNISNRTSYRVIVKISKRGKDNKMDFLCTSENISSSGMLIESDRVLSKGDKIACSFFLPNSVSIVAEGEIVRIAEKENGSKEYGVKFIDLPSSTESQIALFIETWLKRKNRRFS